MDPNAWQAYQAYSRLNAGNRDDNGGYSSPSASLLFAHQQLREAANQHYQNQILPPSLVQAAANNKNHLHQQALANLHQWKGDHDIDRNHGGGSSLSKHSQPAFPGHPPPLDGNGVFQHQPQQQPPPRQSSQLRTHTTPAFPGIAPPQSPGGFSSYSSQTPSPHYGGVTSPSDYERQREKEERRKIEEERRREQERIRREQERMRQEQELKRREADRIRKEQEERRRREEYERRKREEHEKRKREEAERRRREEERVRQEQERRRREEERIREQERIRQEQERLKQERIKQEELEQRKLEAEQRDLGLTRLGALAALNDLDQANEMMYNENMGDGGFSNSINFNELNMFHQNKQNLIKQEEKPFNMNNYNPWLNRANELLDLTSQQQQGAGGSRDSPGSQGDEGGLLPGILMNPWDPQQQANMMSLAPIANAMQQYQQQWLTQYQQAATAMNENSGTANAGTGAAAAAGAAAATPAAADSYPLGKCKVLCISPDDDMGFLINLPAPCNLLYQPNPSAEEAGARKQKDSPFDITYKKFVKDPDSGQRSDLSEAPDKPPNPYPGQYASSDVKSETKEEYQIQNTGKKAYIPPYTPKASFKRDDPCANKSQMTIVRSSGSRGGSTTGRPGRPPGSGQTSINGNSINRSSYSAGRGGSGMGRGGSSSGSFKKSRVEEESSDEEPQYRRESSRRKAKEQSKAKRDAQENLLLDEDDPTLNNPALDLEDSDVDDEWTPVKEKEGHKGRKADYSSEDDFIHEEINRAKKLMKKRAYPEADRISNKRMSAEVSNASNDSFTDNTRVGDFVVLKTETNNPTAAIWKIDGKTLIQKYECFDDETLNYKNVNTFSGWTQQTRAKYEVVEVKHISQSSKETVVKRIFPPTNKSVNGTDGQSEEGAGTSSDPRPVPDQKVNVEEIKARSRSETNQFQENFEVYIQTLISQCLDANFLNEIFADQDDYFVSNIEKVDSVTLLRKDKLLNKTSLNMGFQHCLSVWPCLKDVGPEACNDAVCSGCETVKASTMVQLYGQPYHPNTLSPVQPDENALMNRNFPVCTGCAAISKLYHRLHHQKHKLYMDCSVIVETRKNADINTDTTKILNQLLADDAWLEQQFHVMQEVWADADAFQY